MSKRKISAERKVETVEKYLRGETTLLSASQELGIGLNGSVNIRPPKSF